MGWGGAAKGKSAAPAKGKTTSISPVSKPWLKQEPVGKGKSSWSSPATKTWSSPATSWGSARTTTTSSFAPSYSGKASKGTATKGATSYSKGSSKGTSKGPIKGSSKGDSFGGFKGKGKGKRSAPPASDPFWQTKMDAEERLILDGVYEGTIANYNIKAGWGFISPGDYDSLPDEAKEKLSESIEAAKAAGKTPGDETLLYFRKPDLAEGYRAEKDAAVTFSLYIDNKGAGACDINGA